MAVATKPKPKQTVHHKRRTGAHQKRNTHFVKAYWPYIPLLVIVGVGMFFNSLLAQPSNVLGYATDISPAGLLQSTNHERTVKQLGALALNEQLNQAAQAKAIDMATRNYWSHNTPDGQEPWAFIATAGYTYTAAGENLAYGFITNNETVQGWMNSEGHRANILNNDYSEVGFGIASHPNYQGSGNQTIVVALYAHPAAATTPASAVEPSQAAVTVSQQTGEVKVSRIALISGSAAAWSSGLFTGIIAALGAIFIYRHSKIWHKTLRKGEQFVVHHKTLDVLLVSGIMMAIILLGAGGFVQ